MLIFDVPLCGAGSGSGERQGHKRPLLCHRPGRAGRLKWALQMCTDVHPPVPACILYHSEAFTCIIPKSGLLQNHESLENAHRFLLKTNVLGVLLSEAPLGLLTLTVPL